MNGITVSIFMLVYNQEDYISQAIDGVLMQETNFVYQLVIGEDCSTDNTREICIKYAEKHPDKIKLILNKSNLGLGRNYVNTYSQCTGEYVAICDGDDYWIDPLKLEKQVAILKKEPTYGIVYTSNYNLYSSGDLTEFKAPRKDYVASFADLVSGNFIASVTVLFKRVPLTSTMTKWFSDLPYCDWPTYLLVLSSGEDIFYLNETTAVYRIDVGTSNKLKKRRSQFGEINLGILQNLKEEDLMKSKLVEIQEAIRGLKTGLMASYNKEGKYLKSFRFLLHLMSGKNPIALLRLYLYSLKRNYYKWLK